jgi:hypothetical protein
MMMIFFLFLQKQQIAYYGTYLPKGIWSLAPILMMMSLFLKLPSTQLEDIIIISRMRIVRAGGHRRGSPRYSYNARSAGLVDGAGYPSRIWGVG